LIPSISNFPETASRCEAQPKQRNQDTWQDTPLNASKNPLAIPEDEKSAYKWNQHYLRRIGVLCVRRVSEEIPKLVPLKRE
jgi:hypothetical protein